MKDNKYTYFLILDHKEDTRYVKEIYEYCSYERDYLQSYRICCDYNKKDFIPEGWKTIFSFRKKIDLCALLFKEDKQKSEWLNECISKLTGVTADWLVLNDPEQADELNYFYLYINMDEIELPSYLQNMSSIFDSREKIYNFLLSQQSIVLIGAKELFFPYALRMFLADMTNDSSHNVYYENKQMNANTIQQITQSDILV